MKHFKLSIVFLIFIGFALALFAYPKTLSYKPVKIYFSKDNKRIAFKQKFTHSGYKSLSVTMFFKYGNKWLEYMGGDLSFQKNYKFRSEKKRK